MRSVELLNKANMGYPDGFLSTYYDEKTGKLIEGSGDDLAKFIVIELQETFDENLSDEEQINEANRVLEKAKQDIDDVIVALNSTVGDRIALAESLERK